MCRFGTGARSLLLLAMSLVKITAVVPSCSTLTTSVYVPAARRAVAVLTPFYYIESEGIVFPRGKVPKYPKPLPDYKMRQIDDYIYQDLSVMLLPSPSKMPKMVTKSWQWQPILYNLVRSGGNGRRTTREHGAGRPAYQRTRGGDLRLRPPPASGLPGRKLGGAPVKRPGGLNF
jgi:hypothetical protein